MATWNGRNLLTAIVLAALSSVASLDTAHAQTGTASSGSTEASVPVASSAAPADDFVVPALTGPVVDAANLLSPETRSLLDRGIRNLRDSGGSQLNVLTVPSLGRYEIEQASIKVTDAWKLGGAKTDNGVLLIVAPNERKVRIEVGQGLEGALPDAYANRIVQDVVLPEFRAQQFDRGVLLAVVEIIKKTDPGADINKIFGGEVRESKRGKGGVSRSLMSLIFFIILIAVLSGGGRGGRRRRGSFSPWGAAAMGYGLGRMGGGGGGWGGGSGGGGGWGGGGGGFSGGGASGGW